MKLSILGSIILMSSLLYGNNLKIESCSIKTKTEMTGGSKIQPAFNNCQSSININNEDLSSINGVVSVNISDFKSDDNSRDKHMLETLEISKFSNSKFTIENVKYIKNDEYIISGNLELHGKNRKVNFDSKITKENKNIQIKSKGIILMTDFDIKQPKFMFLEVRNKVELTIDLKLEK
jgi:polyisoprenoid-binding protein YceI